MGKLQITSSVILSGVCSLETEKEYEAICPVRRSIASSDNCLPENVQTIDILNSAVEKRLLYKFRLDVCDARRVT